VKFRGQIRHSRYLDLGDGSNRFGTTDVGPHLSEAVFKQKRLQKNLSGPMFWLVTVSRGQHPYHATYSHDSVFTEKHHKHRSIK